MWVSKANSLYPSRMMDQWVEASLDRWWWCYNKCLRTLWSMRNSVPVFSHWKKPYFFGLDEFGINQQRQPGKPMSPGATWIDAHRKDGDGPVILHPGQTPCGSSGPVLGWTSPGEGQAVFRLPGETWQQTWGLILKKYLWSDPVWGSSLRQT